jgi:FkbM family methyltransferase
MARKIVPDEFNFCPIGLGPTDGSLEFFLPKDESNVSGSFCKQRNVNYSESISLEMRQLSSIAKDLEHSHIDLLKIDIEGFEYDVFQSIIDSGLTIDQICVEFHDRFFPNIPRRSLNSIQQLKSAGFEVFAVSDSLEEVSLIHRRVLGQ